MNPKVKDIVIELAVAGGALAICYAIYLILAATPNLLLQPGDAKYMAIIPIGMLITPVSRKVIGMLVK